MMPYVRDLGSVIDMEAIRAARVKIGVRIPPGAGRRWRIGSRCKPGLRVGFDGGECGAVDKHVWVDG